MRASVKTAYREETCLAFALSRAQRVCNCAPQNVSLYNLYRNYGHRLRAYSFPTDKSFYLFRKVQFSISYFIYFAMSAFSSFSESSKYVQKPINWYGRNAICACLVFACIIVWIFSASFKRLNQCVSDSCHLFQVQVCTAFLGFLKNVSLPRDDPSLMQVYS